MNLDEETLMEIEDYIKHLDEKIGLKAETMLDVEKAINRCRSELNTLVQSGTQQIKKATKKPIIIVNGSGTWKG